MLWQYYVLMAIGIISTLISIYVLFVGIEEKSSKGQINFVLAMVSIFLVCLSSIINLNTSSIEAYTISVKFTYFAKTMCILLMPQFVGGYCGFQPPKLVKIQQWIFTLGFIIVIFTLDYHKLFLYDFVVKNQNLKVYHSTMGIVYLIFVFHALWMFFMVDYQVLFKMRTSQKKEDKVKYKMILIGCMFPTVSTLLYIGNVFGGVDHLNLSLAITSILFYVAIKKYYLFDITQNAKEYVLDHTAEAVIILDAADEVLYMNDAVKQIYPEISMNKPISGVMKMMLESDERSFVIDHNIYDFHITELFRSDGKKEGMLIEIRDVTSINEAMNNLNQLMVDAEQANQAKSAFLANMSHEIRTPINAVLGMDEMILRESSDTTIIEYAESIQNAGKTLLSLINDILDFSKIESGKVEIIPVAYEMQEILDSAKQMLEPRLEFKNINFYVEFASEIPHRLFGDRNRVGQVVTNILTNAAKYTDSGQIVLKIEALPYTVKNETFELLMENAFCKESTALDLRTILRISVTDTGKGIKEEDLNKLFKSFQRVDLEKNRNIEGTGLGLAITKRLLERMGGNITVESTYGKGSTFTIEVPQIVIDNTPLNHGEAVKQEDRKRYQERFHAPDAKILMVDDNAVNLKVFSGLLKKTQVQVTSLRSGMECIELVKQEYFDIIFMDHLMPEMDGIETLHRLNTLEDHKCKNTPVIALTANAIQGAREMYLEKGFTDYLMKPISGKDLEEMMLKHLKKELITDLFE